MTDCSGRADARPLTTRSACGPVGPRAGRRDRGCSCSRSSATSTSCLPPRDRAPQRLPPNRRRRSPWPSAGAKVPHHTALYAAPGRATHGVSGFAAARLRHPANSPVAAMRYRRTAVVPSEPSWAGQGRAGPDRTGPVVGGAEGPPGAGGKEGACRSGRRDGPGWAEGPAQGVGDEGEAGEQGAHSAPVVGRLPGGFARGPGPHAARPGIGPAPPTSGIPGKHSRFQGMVEL